MPNSHLDNKTVSGWNASRELLQMKPFIQKQKEEYEIILLESCGT